MYAHVNLIGDRIEDLKYHDWEQHGCSRYGNISEAEFRCGGIRRTGLLSTWDCQTPSMFFCEKPANGSRAKNLLRHIVMTTRRPEKTTKQIHHGTEDFMK